MRVMAVLAGAVLTFVSCLAAFADDDPFLWLEETGSARAVAWSRAQSNFTLKTLRADPDYNDTFADAQAILTAQDRIPYGNLSAGYVYNFWQDSTHVRGLWRRTPLREYESDDPRWEVLIDLDALSAAQKKRWVWKGAACLQPANARCLIKLSHGGDAVVVHEFDVPTRSFIRDGFYLPEAKTDVAWVDANTILVGTDWGEGTLTRAGYPRIVKIV
jgi:prolyl oligopeptidase